MNPNSRLKTDGVEKRETAKKRTTAFYQACKKRLFPLSALRRPEDNCWIPERLAHGTTFAEMVFWNEVMSKKMKSPGITVREMRVDDIPAVYRQAESAQQVLRQADEDG